MSALTLGGAPVTRCVIHLPLRGVWCADVDVDAAEAPAGRVTLSADGGPAWSGTVVGGAVSHGLWSGRVVGGAGGLRAELDPRAHRNARLADVLVDVLADAGEALAAGSGDLGAAVDLWHRARGSGAGAVGHVADAAGYGWRVLADGSVWLGAEAWPALALDDVSLLELDPVRGVYTLGGETLAIAPGASVTLDVEGEAVAVRVGDVEHVVEPDGYTTKVWAR